MFSKLPPAIYLPKINMERLKLARSIKKGSFVKEINIIDIYKEHLFPSRSGVIKHVEIKWIRLPL